MSRLRELMEELCPSGVEYKKLGEICVILDSHRRPVTKKDRVTGQYPYYGANGIQDYVDDFIFDGTFLLIGEDGSVLTEQGTPVVHWATGKIWVNNHAHILKEKGEILLRFLFHYMQTVKIHHLVKGVPPKLNQNDLREIPIPVPPLEIQNEIVKLLDNFTELTAELTEQLMTELTLRKKQYNFYRDSLLNFVRVDDTIVQTDRQTDRQAQRISKFGLWRKTQHIEWKSLRDISVRISSGGTPRKTNSAYYTGGTIPWLRTQEVEFNYIEKATSFITEEGLKNSSAKWIPAHCVIVAISGATAGRSAVNNIPVTTNQHCCNIEVNEEMVEYKYVFYWVKSQYEKLKGLGRGARADLSAEIIANYPIPVPPLSEQCHIVSILDRFDALCNDLTSGLPAEIAARKKQYEHYRDKLLTFPRSNG